MTKKVKWRVPFDKDGNMMEYYQPDSTAGYYCAHELKENYEFSTALKFLHCNRGRSSVRFIFNGMDGHKYSMTLSAFEDLMAAYGLPKSGEWTGTYTWTFAKRGANYTIQLIKE